MDKGLEIKSLEKGRFLTSPAFGFHAKCTSRLAAIIAPTVCSADE